MDDFIPEQSESESRLTFALYSGLRSDSEDERLGWAVIAEVLCLSCTPVEVEIAKMSALGRWIEEMNIDGDSLPIFFEE